MVENGSENQDKKAAASVIEQKTLQSTLFQEKTQLEIPLPTDCFPLTHQVAGHFYGKGRTKLGLLQTNDGLVLKPVQSPPRGEREHEFFKRIFLSEESSINEDEKELKKLLPTYRGSFIHNDIMYIKMDDLAYGIQNPAVIDFKMGRITYDPDATIEKINRQKLKYPPVEKIGFQLIGMRVYNKAENSFSHYDKIFGRALSEEDLVHGLALYYQHHQTPQIHAIKETIEQIEKIQEWFEKQTTYHFYASSLIGIYEANLEDMLKESPQSVKPSNLVRITMADFAHVFPGNNTRDENYLYGLKKLVDHLKLMLKVDYTFKDVRGN